MFITEKRAQKIRNILKKRQKDLQIFSDNVTNQHNFSAILRTSDAVGVLYLYYRYLGEGELINEEITMGSHKWVIHQEVKDINSFFKEKKKEGFQIVATYLSEDSVHFREIDYTKPTLIVVGNEIQGVSKEVLEYADNKIIIPMYGMAQSLNVSVATGVILYEAQRQREEKGMYDKPSLSEEEIENILHKWSTEELIKYKMQESAIRHIKKINN
ncbi:tRNA (guanosine-2'-O-)-methyltransferase [Persephonella hydrogeniphila]|uniref:tRNA (guanosine(18)-2'-O)-methyltransferase n=1 Tax=Persephonella hydrogeniphila TaxID=198703 RepID=A0A285N099_9AQUI|nr:TrmH family RNA methyltransferase [Persephonella hydrogeniphila]SNZ02860.1 tRNA (guanosine-2'-O-)-methyltransferase [Persephonella hydrogeniphila]